MHGRRAVTMLLSGLLLSAAAAGAPVNVAPKAKVWASSEYNATWAAKYAIDGTVPTGGRGNDARKAWAIHRAKAGDQAEFTLQWPQPVDVATIVYWGRTGSLVSECWKDYELYLDDDVKPAEKGTFRMCRGPQRIDIAPRQARKVRLKFLNSYGPYNPGASEIAVYPAKPSDEQLDWFPLEGMALDERIAQTREERANLWKVASTIPGKVVFLTGTRPRNDLDWQAPMFAPPTATSPLRGRNYMDVSNHTHRCTIEKDTPGPFNAGHQVFILDPAQPDPEPRLLVDAGAGWIGCAMSASHDGEALYFSMAPEGDPFFHIYRVPASGGKPEPLTRGTFQDVDPDVLPDGRIVFCSTRFGSREEYHGYLASTLFTMTAKGEDIRALTYHVVNDREPKVTADGKIVFVRQDNFFMNAKIETEIHHINADGTGGFVLFGQDVAGSGVDRAAMHEVFPEAVGFLSPSRLNFKREGNAFGNPTPLPDGRVAALCAPTGRWSATQPFQKHAIGIVVSNSGASGIDGVPVPTSKPLHDISALPDGRLLCSTLDRRALGVVDLTTGHVAPFYVSSREDIQAPLYVGPRTKPVSRKTAAPARDTGRATGFFYCQNLFQTRQVHADLDRIKAVRVLEGRPLTIRMLACDAYHGGVNHIGTEAVELGVAPLCPDGSFYVEAPADRALAFQAIDAEGRAVINELSWIYIRPGERRGCVGCHAGPTQALKPVRVDAVGAPAVRLTGEGAPFRYKANALAHGGVTGSSLDRIRETKSINLYPYPHARSARGAPPLPPGRATTTETLCDRVLKGTAAERVSAAQRLGGLRNRSAVPALIAAMQDSQAAVRMNAAMALASCGNRQARDALLTGILDPDVQVVLASHMALAHLTGHRESLDGVGRGDFERCATRWKQWLAAHDWPQIEQQQIEQLKSKDPQAVILAVQALGHVGGAAAQDALRAYARRCLGARDATDLRSLVDAMRGLGHLGDTGAVPLQESILAAHIPLPKKGRSAKLAAAAAEALGWIGDAEAERALVEQSRHLLPFWRYNLAVGDQGGGWGDYLTCSPVHFRFLEAFDAMGARVPKEILWTLTTSLHMSFDQPLLLELDTYETLLARVVQRSGSLDAMLDTCFALIGVGKGAVDEAFKKALVDQVVSQRYPQMHGKNVAFTVPQRVAHILNVLGIRPEDAPRYQEAFEMYRRRYLAIRKDYRGLETGACAWICYYALETLGRLECADAYETFLGALQDPPEAVDGLPPATAPTAHLATTPHYRVAAAFGLGQIGRHEALPALLEAVGNFDNALEVRHTAARALVKLCDRRDLKTLQALADSYPEVHTRRVLLRACEEAAMPR
ncbi:HEAT repeat domain-containing protein [bacterium]|nr:HEAT repeat domain-containing protein [bacterium]